MRVTGLYLRPSLGAARLASRSGRQGASAQGPRPLTGRRSRVPRRPQTAHPTRRWSGTSGLLPAPSPANGIATQASSSQKARLYRRPSRAKRQLALGLLRHCALQVRQYLRNELRLLDAGDDLELPTTAPNTRFSRRAQLIATCRGDDGLAGSASDTGGFDRGIGTSAASRAIRSSGSNTMWVVPCDDHGGDAYTPSDGGSG